MKHSAEHNLSRRIACNKYEKTKNGFIMRLYRNMKSRVTGIQWSKHHLYVGCEILPKEEFYKWASSNSEFHRLFANYEANGFPRKLASSVDRIDSRKGYEISNMEFVTMSENSRRGSVSQHRQRRAA